MKRINLPLKILSMAIPEHVAIFKQGTEVWNKWRKENPKIKPDLSEYQCKDFGEASILHQLIDETDPWHKVVNSNTVTFTITQVKMQKLIQTKNDEPLGLVGINLQGVNLHKAVLVDENLLYADFRDANLSLANLSGSCLAKCNFNNADLSYAYIIDSDITKSIFDCANLHGACLAASNLTEAKIRRSNLINANFNWVNFTDAIIIEAKMMQSTFVGANFNNCYLVRSSLQGSNLSGSSLIRTDLSETSISDCRIFGINIWGIQKENLSQKSLIITPENEPKITVDDLETAQFIYLLLNNQAFRNVIETFTSKAVLILGRFTEERKRVLDAMRDELRNRDFLPILFDFEKPSTRNLTETISILAKLSRFIIADLTDAKSIPQELSHIIPFIPTLPVMPIILQGQREYAMFEHWRPYPWVLPIYEYQDESQLIATFSTGVIEPAEKKLQEIRGR